MAGEKVISGDMRITLDDKTVYHSISCSLSMSREFKDRATKDTTGIERRKGTKTWSASVEGLATYDGDGSGTMDFFAVFDAMANDTATPLDIEFVPEEGDAGFKLTGEAFIESVDKTMANDDDATLSISLTGNGFLTKTAIV